MHTAMININNIELIPAYGRDYKSKADVLNAFRAGKDFEGGFQVAFRYVNVSDFAPGTKVLLRYKGKTRVAVITV
jgi:hypothetical protein